MNTEKYDASYAKYCDHTILKPEATHEMVKKFCDEAKEYGFAAVCVNPVYVSYVSELLKGSSVKTCCVIGFPLGANTTLVKVVEARDAIANGAEEVDMVMNVGALKEGNYDIVLKDIRTVVEAAAGKAAVKVILETSLLTDEEIIKACQIAKEAGVQFVKTSTGFGSRGASVNDVILMKRAVGPDIQIKASTGIKTREDADKMIKASATRLGTSSGIKIVHGE
ncbi:MAG: deoxyribose-phosphate aldolase [Clostridiaceae bacterium]|nr:deoxyribose-phosphate aldolase [Clostridiaceae bacterium]